MNVAGSPEGPTPIVISSHADTHCRDEAVVCPNGRPKPWLSPRCYFARSKTVSAGIQFANPLRQTRSLGTKWPSSLNFRISASESGPYCCRSSPDTILLAPQGSCPQDHLSRPPPFVKHNYPIASPCSRLPTSVAVDLGYGRSGSKVPLLVRSAISCVRHARRSSELLRRLRSPQQVRHRKAPARCLAFCHSTIIFTAA